MEKQFEAKAALITGGLWASGVQQRFDWLRKAPASQSPILAEQGRNVCSEIEAAVAFLGSDEASFIIGAIVAVDGGSLAKGR